MQEVWQPGWLNWRFQNIHKTLTWSITARGHCETEKQDNTGGLGLGVGGKYKAKRVGGWVGWLVGGRGGIPLIEPQISKMSISRFLKEIDAIFKIFKI